VPNADSSSRLESGTKIVTSIVAIATIIGGAVEYYTTYRHQREIEHQANVRESQKAFLDHQLSLYFEATSAASTIATSKAGSQEREKAETRFWQLYWGELSAVENGEVESAMVDFGNVLKAKGGRTWNFKTELCRSHVVRENRWLRAGALLPVRCKVTRAAFNRRRDQTGEAMLPSQRGLIYVCNAYTNPVWAGHPCPTSCQEM
jgi:hypothetical protein